MILSNKIDNLNFSRSGCGCNKKASGSEERVVHRRQASTTAGSASRSSRTSGDRSALQPALCVQCRF